MQLYLKTPPSQEPVTLEEVKIYLRILTEHEDDILKTLLSSSRASIENATGRALLKQEWVLSLTPPYPPSFPLAKNKKGDLTLTLPLPPLLSVESVKTEEKNVSYKLEGSKVILSARLWGKPLVIDFWAGYGDTPASLPPDLKMAVLMAIRFFYEGQKGDLSFLKPYRVLKIT